MSFVVRCVVVLVRPGTGLIVPLASGPDGWVVVLPGWRCRRCRFLRRSSFVGFDREQIVFGLAAGWSIPSDRPSVGSGAVFVQEVGVGGGVAAVRGAGGRRSSPRGMVPGG